MTSPSNGVTGQLEDISFHNGNMDYLSVNGNIQENVVGEERLIPEQFSSEISNYSGEINSLSDNDSNGVLLRCNFKGSETQKSKAKLPMNNSRETSEGYCTGHEDFSGFDGAPVSLEIPSLRKEGASDDDEYFEEFHLPNTYENAFVRHQSFRKKVNLTPIIAPDAERIEGLVRTGSFRRHDSIRRKILPEEEELDVDETDSVSSLAEQLRQDIEEIEQILLSESQLNASNDTGVRKLVSYSTPISENHIAVNSTNSIDYPSLQITDDSSLINEQDTVRKIKDCLDVSKYKNIYHLSGRLQDILTPQEIEDVLNNSEKYSSFLTAEVLEALSMSLHEITLSEEESEVQNSPDDIKMLSKSEDYKSGPPSSLELKVIKAPIFDLNATDDSESFDVSDIETPNTSKLFNSFNTLDESVDRPKSKRKLSVEGLSFTSVSCYSSPSVASDQHISAEAISPLCFPLPFSNVYADLPLAPPPDLIPDANDSLDENHWRNVVIAGVWKRIDMKAVNPYKSFISHGGYAESGSQVVVISASFLPKKKLKEYHYIMDNLFMYVLSILEQLVSEDYILVYFAGGRSTSGPGFHWMRKAYDMIDHRIRKNMKRLLIVHPSLWARTLVILSKPFISSKFYRKVSFVHNLTDLAHIVSLNNIQIPEIIKQLDFELMINEKKTNKR